MLRHCGDGLKVECRCVGFRDAGLRFITFDALLYSFDQDNTAFSCHSLDEQQPALAK
jgi:hypothetical protein